MKLKTKLASLIIGFVMVASMLFFGVWAASSANVTLGGTISFSSTNVYAEVSGTISGNANTIDPLETLTFKNGVTQEDDVWARNLEFDENGGTITMTITIKNMASDRKLYASVIDQVGIVDNVTKTMSIADFELMPLGSKDGETPTDQATVTITMKVTNSDLSLATGATYGYLVDLKDGSAVKSISEYAEEGLALSVSSGNATVSSYTGSLKTFNIPAYVSDENGVYSVTGFGLGALTSSGIENVTLPSTITSLDYGFYECTTLKSIILPDSVTLIGDEAFMGCSNLISVVFGNNTTRISGSAFKNCTSLANINIPSSVIAIDDYAFDNCPLTCITIDEANTIYEDGDCNAIIEKSSNTLIKGSNTAEIPSYIKCLYYNAFARYTFTSITIPVSVIEIKLGAFDYCESLTDIYYEGNAEQWSAINIAGTGNEVLSSATIHYGA